MSAIAAADTNAGDLRHRIVEAAEALEHAQSLLDAFDREDMLQMAWQARQSDLDIGYTLAGCVRALGAAANLFRLVAESPSRGPRPIPKPIKWV
jgi:hypothetical protein